MFTTCFFYVKLALSSLTMRGLSSITWVNGNIVIPMLFCLDAFYRITCCNDADVCHRGYCHK